MKWESLQITYLMGFYPGYMEALIAQQQQRRNNLKKMSAQQLTRHLLKENIYMVSKHMKRCSVGKYGKCSKKMENNELTRMCKKVGTLVYCRWECKMAQLPWDSLVLLKRYTQNYHVTQRFHSLVHIQKNWKAGTQRDNLRTSVHSSVHDCQKVETTYMCVKRLLDKQSKHTVNIIWPLKGMKLYIRAAAWMNLTHKRTNTI